MDASATLQKACLALTAEDLETSKVILRSEIPFNANATLSSILQSSSLRPKNLTPKVDFAKSRGTRLRDNGKAELFMRDGFIDRYEGTRLVFPGVLRLFSHLMPLEFPFHPHWKLGECHPLYWILQPTLDHMLPTPRGGPDTPENMVCTSMLNNTIKGNRTVEEVGWKVLPPGNSKAWDGQIHWYVRYIEIHRSLLSIGYLNNWYRAAKRAIGSGRKS